MRWYYEFTTEHGDFRIVQTPHGWAPTFDDEHLGGTYRTPDQALEELIAGHTDDTPFGSAAALGVSPDLEIWDECKG